MQWLLPTSARQQNNYRENETLKFAWPWPQARQKTANLHPESIDLSNTRLFVHIRVYAKGIMTLKRYSAEQTKTLQEECCRLIKTFLTWFCVLFMFSIPAFCQSGPPTLPVNPYLDSYSFADTNWLSDIGYAPIDYTNLVSVPEWDGNALLLDTTNALPAFLNYNIVELDGTTNLAFPAGAVRCVFICDWASADTNQNGTGPGEVGYLLAAGDFSSNSPDGLWAVYIDPGGTNIYFGGVSNSESTVFVSAPISWPSNSIHLIGLAYSTNSTLYLDGQLAATGGPVTIVPATDVWTNGFFVGSDASGSEQARGIFWNLEFYNSNCFDSYWINDFERPFFTHAWLFISNAYYASQGTQGGSGADFAAAALGSLVPLGGGGGCASNNAVYMTDMSYTVISGQGFTFTFTIAGGTNGLPYDVFSTTNLAYPITNSVWTWLGQGTNCGVYSITNLPNTPSFYVLGTPLLAGDDSGLTVAYERLIGVSSDGYGTPNLWYLWHGLSPAISGVGIGGDDADGDGLLNYQEYLYGTNPQVSEGFAVWVAEPGLTSGIP
jgi:hypothetical protein